MAARTLQLAANLNQRRAATNGANAGASRAAWARTLRCRLDGGRCQLRFLGACIHRAKPLQYWTPFANTVKAHSRPINQPCKTSPGGIIATRNLCAKRLQEPIHFGLLPANVQQPRVAMNPHHESVIAPPPVPVRLRTHKDAFIRSGAPPKVPARNRSSHGPLPLQVDENATSSLPIADIAARD